MARAVNLVRGPWLDGFSLPDCPAFDEWLFFQRERLQLQITAALEQLADFREHTGNGA
jgi:DNA-binding SARP family transcriptional activator